MSFDADDRALRYEQLDRDEQQRKAAMSLAWTTDDLRRIAFRHLRDMVSVPTADAMIVEDAADKIDRLERWKEEALVILNRWEEVAALIPMEPGTIKSEAVKDHILQLWVDNKMHQDTIHADSQKILGLCGEIADLLEIVEQKEQT